MSKKLDKHQVHYGQTKKELLAAVTAVTYWRHYLLCAEKPFKLVTDCTAVQDLMAKKEISGIFARWVMALGEYDFEIEYKKGSLHTDADAMSRFQEIWYDEGDEVRSEDVDCRS